MLYPSIYVNLTFTVGCVLTLTVIPVRLWGQSARLLAFGGRGANQRIPRLTRERAHGPVHVTIAARAVQFPCERDRDASQFFKKNMLMSIMN